LLEFFMKKLPPKRACPSIN